MFSYRILKFLEKFKKSKIDWSLSIVFGFFILNSWWLGYSFSEDTFIFFRYAENLVNGFGLNFNQNERVEGYTSVTWVLLLSIGYFLGFKTTDWAFFLSSILTILTLIKVYCITRSQVIDKRIAFLPSLFLVFDVPFVYTSLCGLDEILFIYLFLSALFYEFSPLEKGKRFSNIFWVLTILTRPEGVALWAIVKIVNYRTTYKSIIKNGLFFEFLPLVFYTAHILIRFIYYGQIFPNTYYVKTGGDQLALIYLGLNYLKEWLYESGYIPLGLGLLIFISNIKKVCKDRFNITVGVLVIFWLCYLIKVGGDWIPGFRFTLVISPLLFIFIVKNLPLMTGKLSKLNFLLLIAFLIYMARDRIGYTSEYFQLLINTEAVKITNISIYMLITFLVIAYFIKREEIKKIKYTFIFIICFCNYCGSIHSSKLVWAIREQANIVIYLSAIGKWLNRNIPENFHIALNPAGAVPYYSNLPTIDMLGLNDKFIAHSKNETMGGGVNIGHDKSAPTYVLQRRPEIILLGLNYLSEEPIGFFDKRYYRYNSDRGLLRDPIFRGEYTIVSIENAEVSFKNPYSDFGDSIKGSPIEKTLNLHILRTKSAFLIEHLKKKGYTVKEENFIPEKSSS